MTRAAVQLVEKAGIKMEHLCELLVASAAAELSCYYNFTILCINLTGIDGKGVKDVVDIALIEERNHFEALVSRIYELDGEVPQDMKSLYDLSSCPPALLPKDPTDVRAILTVLAETERWEVRGYTAICDLTAGKDHRTYDLALAILNEEIEHEAWFSELLGEGGSGQINCRRNVSPFVSKFLR